MHTASLANANAKTTANQYRPTRPAISATNEADDAFISWRCARRDPTQPTKLQFKVDKCNQMIDQFFMVN